jgi:hypothetical protein
MSGMGRIGAPKGRADPFYPADPLFSIVVKS